MIPAAQAAQMLGVTRHTLYQQIKAGRLSAMRVNRAWHFDPVELERYALHVRHLPVTAASFWARVDKSAGLDECWPWTRARQGKGYGSVRWNGRTRPAYRVAFELTHGPVPEGLELDHLCKSYSCCNPAHLEAVTHAENMRRSPYGPFEVGRSAVECIHGHPFTDENTHWNPRGNRVCRTCAQAAWVRSRARRQEVA